MILTSGPSKELSMVIDLKLVHLSLDYFSCTVESKKQTHTMFIILLFLAEKKKDGAPGALVEFIARIKDIEPASWSTIESFMHAVTLSFRFNLQEVWILI